MKTRLIIAILAATALFCSCKERCEGCYDCDGYPDVVKPYDLKPIDWNGWNDVYTVFHTFYDNMENAQYSHRGDTIRCCGKLPKEIYENCPSFEYLSSIYFESEDDERAVTILLSTVVNSSDRDSLKSIFDSSSYSDTCFVKGVLHLLATDPIPCYVRPAIELLSIEDIYFKKSQP